jgi:hypothetical protein
VKEPCLTPGTGAGDPDFRVCDDPQTRAFWDDIHPTLAGHKFLAFVAITAWERAADPAAPAEGPSVGRPGSKEGGLEDDVLRRVREHIEREESDADLTMTP